MSQTGKREWQTSPTDRDRNKMHACQRVCAATDTQTHAHTHRQTHRRPVVHPLTGRWPDSPAAAGCLMFHSEDHISLPDSSSNRRETERQRQREALLPRHRPDTTKHGLTACVSPHHITHTHIYQPQCECTVSKLIYSYFTHTGCQPHIFIFALTHLDCQLTMAY